MRAAPHGACANGRMAQETQCQNSLQCDRWGCLMYPAMCFGHGMGDKKIDMVESEMFTPQFDTISWPAIVERAANPQNVEKHKGDWVIPSTLHDKYARQHSTQRRRGEFYMLSVDIDEGNLDLAAVVAGVRMVLDPGTEFLVFATKNSGRVDPEEGYDGGKRWRVFTTSGRAIPGRYFTSLMRAFTEDLEAVLGVKVDGVTSRPGQLLFLANRGAHYEFHVEHGVPWGRTPTIDGAISMQDRAARYVVEGQQKEEARREHKKARGPYLAEFNRLFPTENMLPDCGFITINGKDWHHPEIQTSKSYGTTLRENGVDWVSATPSVVAFIEERLDKDFGTGGQFGGGDSFDLHVAFNDTRPWNEVFRDWKNYVDSEAEKRILQRLEQHLHQCSWMAGFTCNEEHMGFGFL